MKIDLFLFLFSLTLLSCSHQPIASDQLVNKGYYAILGEDIYGELFIVELKDRRILFTQHNDVIGWSPGHVIDTITKDSVIFDPVTFSDSSSINLRIIKHTHKELILEFGNDEISLVPFISNLSGEQYFELVHNDYENKYQNRRDSVLRMYSLLRTTQER